MGSNPIAPQKLTDMKTYKTTFGTIWAREIVSIHSICLSYMTNAVHSRANLRTVTHILGNGFQYITYITYIDPLGNCTEDLSYDVERLTLEEWIKQHEV